MHRTMLLLFIVGPMLKASSETNVLSLSTNAWTKGQFEHTSIARTNGCTLLYCRSTSTAVVAKGYWGQSVMIRGAVLARIEHDDIDKSRSLVLPTNTDFDIILVDTSLDSTYKTWLVVDLNTRALVDVLVMQEAGRLRHATEDEFRERQSIAARNRRIVQEAVKVIEAAHEEAKQSLEKALKQ